MKTGSVAKRFKIDPKTVKAWTDEFSEFFSDNARGIADGQLQRFYEPEDLIVLNTIRSERAQRVPPEQIHAKLTAGERNRNLPPELTQIEGSNAIAVYSQMSATQMQLQKAEDEINRLREEVKAERTINAELNREIGKWQTLAEVYKEQLRQQNDGKTLPKEQFDDGK
jgi:DNA-binding transcriptional MerR regulator